MKTVYESYGCSIWTKQCLVSSLRLKKKIRNCSCLFKCYFAHHCLSCNFHFSLSFYNTVKQSSLVGLWCWVSLLNRGPVSQIMPCSELRCWAECGICSDWWPLLSPVQDGGFLPGAGSGRRAPVQGRRLPGWSLFLWSSRSGWNWRFTNPECYLQPAGQCLFLPAWICKGLGISSPRFNSCKVIVLSVIPR